MTEELKSCPFCGKNAKIKATCKNNKLAIWCECSGCGASTSGSYLNMYDEYVDMDNIEEYKNAEIKKWNRRLGDE